MATGFPVKANYATGDVLTAANMNDLSGTLNYLQYLPPRNPVLNSNFSVWQRGTSNVTTSLAYTADRWQKSTVTAYGVSRQTTSDTTNLPNIQYCARVQRTAGSTSTSVQELVQSIETVNSIPFAGKTVTLSFYARAGANYSSASSAFIATVYSGTGTDGNLLTAWTGGATPVTGTATLTTTWQRFSYTGTISASATQLAILFYNTPVGTAGANDYYEVTGVQLELGSTANTYMPNQPTYQGELSACQRYYWRNTTGSTYGQLGSGFGYSATISEIALTHPVQMRIAPTSVDYSTLFVSNILDPGKAVSSLSLISTSATPLASMVEVASATGLTAYRPYFLTGNNSTTAYIGLNAEL